MKLLRLAVLAVVLMLSVSGLLAGPRLSFDRSWSHFASQSQNEPQADVFDQSAAEIIAHDLTTQRVFVVNGSQDRIDVLNANNGNFLGTLDVSAFGKPNSVASKHGKVAVAVQAANPQSAGSVVFFDAGDSTIATGGASTGNAAVGAMPDMVTFTPDGTKVIVANEGEPNSYGQSDSVDPVGSLSIVEVANLTNVTTASFAGFDKASLVADGVRISSPVTTAAQDIEPEYITVAPDGAHAYVTLQENNAIAEVDLSSGEISAIHALGTKDHNAAVNALDASDRDDAIAIRNWPAQGMYMPDTIGSYEVGGQTYLVTANEGDARDYTGFTDETRVEDLTLDSAVFSDPTTLQREENLGRLQVSSVGFDGSMPATFDELFSFGARSFSIWDALTGDLVFDSGDDFERITGALGLLDQDSNPVFNSTNDSNGSFDSRSDAKGPEPEALVLGQIHDNTLAFIGLERIGGIMIYDITDPSNPEFLQYLLDRDFSVDAETVAAGDLGPEGMYFLTPELSPTGGYGLLVANEVSGNTTYYDIKVPVPAPLALLAAGLLPLLHLRPRPVGAAPRRDRPKAAPRRDRPKAAPHRDRPEAAPRRDRRQLAAKLALAARCLPQSTWSSQWRESIETATTQRVRI